MKNWSTHRFFALLVTALLPIIVSAQLPPTASVSFPYEEFRLLMDRAKAAEFAELLEQAAPGLPAEGQPPTDFTITSAIFSGTINEGGAKLEGTIKIRILRDVWVKVPLMGTDAVLRSVKLDKVETTLFAEGRRYFFTTDKAGDYILNIEFEAPSSASGSAGSCRLPLPSSTITLLELTLPGSSRNVVINPSLVSQREASDDSLTVRAVVPLSDGVDVSWAGTTSTQFDLYRAEYQGRLESSSALFDAEMRVEVAADAVVDVPFLPSSVALSGVSLDGKEVTVRVADRSFVLPVRGPGRHTIKSSFALPVVTGKGPESVSFAPPSCPVSTLRFTVPGPKRVKISPALGHEVQINPKSSSASVTLAMADQVKISWIDEIPLAEVETRAHLTTTEAVTVSEGVIHVDYYLDVDVIRGSTDSLRFAVPANGAILAVEGHDIRDWRTEAGTDGGDALNVYLNRKVSGKYSLLVRVETQPGEIEGLHDVPSLSGLDFEREKGIVVMLRSDDFKLVPGDLEGLARVDSDQIPAHVRQRLAGEVLYTYRFLQPVYSLSVDVRPPDPVEARVAVTLVSLATLSEDLLKMHTTVELHITRSAISRVDLALPKQVSIVRVGGANILDWTVGKGPDGQQLVIELKDRQKGRLSLSVDYDLKIEPDQAKVDVPMITVLGGWSESGVIGVEKVGNLEVGTAAMDGLAPVDAAQLPTTMSGLADRKVQLAYRFARTPFELALTVTSHTEMEVPTAFIDTANYMSLLTAEGVLLTEAVYQVRNWGSQFLKLTLPAEAELWSAQVDDQPVQPVVDEAGHVLIPLKRSATVETQPDQGESQSGLQPYPVKVVYRSGAAPLDRVGSTLMHLPDVDVRVSEMIWSVYLPDGYDYRRFVGNVPTMADTGHHINLAQASSYDKERLAIQISGRNLGELQSPQQFEQAVPVEAQSKGQNRRQEVSDMLMYNQVLLESSRLQAAQQDGVGPGAHAIRIVIPRQGRLYRFSKLYPTESEQAPHMRVRYLAASVASGAGQFMILFTILVFVYLGASFGNVSRKTLTTVVAAYLLIATVVCAVTGMAVWLLVLAAGLSAGVAVGLCRLAIFTQLLARFKPKVRAN